ncbi:hypothetical protein GA0070606_1410 [Micromonospora citrea]|uniref:Uncharacterized protein n=1 Tax=Micromonospora citrea TaxID=47855 RepID=A0A1C6U5C2_9ACTN|nr:hypothetical protein [Micromonospora citrea]SCL49069.1 hypothetical protein GA0070606_1410 [Micromonospora citrea]
MAEDAYLQMIQSVITRLATQSTAVKTWCVTVTAALLGFGAKAETAIVVFIAFYVIVAFAVLDAYYLCLERAYRTLYRDAVSQATASWTLTINGPGLADVLRGLRSPSIALVYGSSILAILGVGTYVALAG